MKERLWLAMSLQKWSDLWATNAGPFTFTGPEGSPGYLPVYATVKAARKAGWKRSQLTEAVVMKMEETV